MKGLCEWMGSSKKIHVQAEGFKHSLGAWGGGGELHTHSKVEVQEDKLLVRLQYAVDELADAEELHLLS